MQSFFENQLSTLLIIVVCHSQKTNLYIQECQVGTALCSGKTLNDCSNMQLCHPKKATDLFSTSFCHVMCNI